jgi:hypothetical protein
MDLPSALPIEHVDLESASPTPNPEPSVLGQLTPAFEQFLKQAPALAIALVIAAAVSVRRAAFAVLLALALTFPPPVLLWCGKQRLMELGCGGAAVW